MSERLAEKFSRTVIISFRIPTTDRERRQNLVCITATRKDGKGGDVVVMVNAPILEAPDPFVQTTRATLTIPESFRPPEDFFGYPFLDQRTLALHIVLPQGELFCTRSGQVFTIPCSQWLVTKGYLQAGLETFAHLHGILKPLSVWEKREVAFRAGLKPGQAVRLVNTLSEEEILAAVQNGQASSVLHSVQESYKLDLWDKRVGMYVRMGNDEPWHFPDFIDNKPGDIDFVAPFVCKRSHSWGFLLFRCSWDWENGLLFEFLRRSSMIPEIGDKSHKLTFAWKWGAESFLCKEVTGRALTD